MKKISSLLLFVAVVFCSLTLMAQNQVITYHFEHPQISTNSEGFSELNFRDCRNFAPEGSPLLPYFAGSVVLSPGTEISAINILTVKTGETIENVSLRPASRNFPISKGAPKNYKVVPDFKIYSSNEAYPAEQLGNISTGFLSGFSIGTFTICPVIYYPAENKVVVIREISVEIQTVATPKALEALSNLKYSERSLKRIGNIAGESDQLNSYSALDGGRDNNYDILIITKADYIPEFQNYIAFKQSTGYAVAIKSTEEIYTQYSGADQQTKIRACIIDFYQNQGIDYVILAGDAAPTVPAQNIVPCRGLYADPGSGYADDNIPSDMYYCCLDGNWNTDGDTKWGEPNEADLYAEVGIGRLCVDTPVELQNMLNKLTKYQDAPVVADINKGLMVGEQLDSNPTWGGDSKEEIVTGGNHNGYTTAPMPANITITRLYEKLGNWTKQQVFAQFSTTGTHLLNHLGHSNVDYNMKMYNSDVTNTNFSNNGVTRGYVIGYSQGCYNGSFDNRSDGGSYGSDDCFTEKITTITNGMVASIGNSRYGWYEPSGTNGASQFCDRQFFDAMFGENIFMIGDVNNDSKEDNVSYINQDQVVRWCAYETNLFGDPTMDIWSNTPTDIVATYAPSVSIGASQISFQTNTPNARIALIQDGALIGRGLADASGNATVLLSSPITSVEQISVSIIGHNRNRHQGNIVVIANQPYVIYLSNTLSDPTGNNNGLPDFGENLNVNLSLQNVGTVAATGVQAVLSTTDPFITITDNMESFGNFDPGQTINMNNAFAFSVSDMVPDQHTVSFTIDATGQSTWTSWFTAVVNAPELMIGGCTINDQTSGNGNGRLDPGETVTLCINTSNNGHCVSNEVIGNLTTSSPDITIDNSNQNLGIMAIGQSIQANYVIHVAANAQIGDVAEFNFALQSGQYSVVSDLSYKIGLIVEDFETGNFTQYNWTFAGNQPWTITNSGAFEGTFCAVSGVIGNSQNTEMKLTWDVATADSISFFAKVSSEAGYDFLQFFIDNTKLAELSGEVAWQRFAYAVSAGDHTFRWKYVKDSYVVGGQDKAWVDFVEFPSPDDGIMSVNAGNDGQTCESNPYTTVGANAVNYNTLLWTTSGSGIFNNPGILETSYTPSAGDVLIGSVTLTLTITGQSGSTLNDNLLLVFVSNPSVPSIPSGNDLICQNNPNTTYTVPPVNNVLAYAWQLTPAGAGTVIANGTSASIDWSVSFSGQAEIKVAVNNACGMSDYSQPLVITVSPLPAPAGLITGDQDVCQGYSSTFTTGAISNANTYNWTLTPGSAGEITNNGSEISILFNASYTGAATLTVNGVNDCGSGSNSPAFNLMVMNCTGVENLIEQSSFTISPNPASANLSIAITNPLKQGLSIKICNIYGDVVLAVMPNEIMQEMNMDISMLPDGLYFVVIINGRFVSSKKLIITH